MKTRTRQPELKQLAMPKIFQDLFRPKRFKNFHGGRGSAKSWSVAQALVVIAYSRRVRILCARELQISIADSVHKLLKDTIDRMELAQWFDVTATSIKCLLTDSEFIFKGLRHNANEIKSMEGIDICWVEEAQRVSHESWELLIPTIRKPDSEIWLTMNPDSENDPSFQRFIATVRDDLISIEVNYDKNPYFPEVLRLEMEYMKRTDFDAYEHVWLGKAKGRSKSLVFYGKTRVDCFEPPEDARFYYGADWGFSQDPSVLMRCYIVDRTLYIDQESWGIGVELDELPELFNAVPGVPEGDALIKADSSRPETISHMSGKGFSIRAAKKWAGSVEDGLGFLRAFEEIVIHERCAHIVEEAHLYSYKTDKVTGEVLPVLIDKHNHCWDATRYALDGLIKRGGGQGFLDFATRQLAELKRKQEEEKTNG